MKRVFISAGIYLSSSFLFALVPQCQSASPAEHLYPLAAEHAQLPCSSCHPNPYKQMVEEIQFCTNCHREDIPNTPRKDCLSCHQEDRPQDRSHKLTPEESCLNCHDIHFTPAHYGPHCASCHQTDNWLNRRNAEPPQKCVTCHDKDTPHKHYSLQDCGFCHQRTNWNNAEFKHHGFNRCEPCHARPKYHQPGHCIRCHEIESWENA